ncbi:dihydroneopterin aldolase [Sulfurimonas sp. SAG-AH-194-L11]|nr:dihydroneopterin aldolase [Sulfurimonas sp. SAG-AH-194-L11]MDF1876427.1 dihydroneopterin aldolase [Sulfurimonas sp. SAG-AH-194-L11]
MKVYIEDLKFLTIIGILDFERTTPQEIIVKLSLEYHYEEQFINYADVSQHIKETLQTQQFLLIEDALLFLQDSLKKEFSTITTLELKITKPSIMPDCMVSVGIFKDFNS